MPSNNASTFFNEIFIQIMVCYFFIWKSQNLAIFGICFSGTGEILQRSELPIFQKGARVTIFSSCSELVFNNMNQLFHYNKTQYFLSFPISLFFQIFLKITLLHFEGQGVIFILHQTKNKKRCKGVIFSKNYTLEINFS